MSRVFTAKSNLVQAPPSPASDSLTALTLACWVLMTDYGAFGFPALVKDPNGAYGTYLYVNGDGTLTCKAGGATVITGYVDGLVVNPGQGGTGYALNDTGTCIGHGDGLCKYRVAQVDGGGAGPGEITDLAGVAGGGGSGYAANNTGALLPGGIQPGTGINGQYKVTSVTTQNHNALSMSIETVSLNTWVHLMMTWDAVSGTVKIYINGVECTYSGQTVSTAVDASTDGWGIGKDSFGDAGVSQQKQTAVFNRVLSATERAALAASPNTVQGIADSNLIAYWPLISASPEPDLSGYGADGAIVTATPPETVASTTPLKQVSMTTPVASASMS